MATAWPVVVLDGSAAPRLGHAIALAEGGEPARALTLLQALQAKVPAAPAAQAPDA